MKQVLVTGAAGFIGFHLSQELLAKGFFVYGLDNLITGQQENIDILTKNKKFNFVKADVCKLNDFKHKISYLFHFASPASPADFKELSMEIALVNSLGTLNMLHLAQKHKAYFIYASTSEIYGDPLVHPQPESYFGNVNTLGWRSTYDESKRFGEAIVSDFMRKEKLRGNIVRIFNTYGPHMRLDDGRVVSNFIAQALKNENITIYGHGKQTRSLCYVADLVEQILTIALDKKNPNEVYNIGNDEEKTVLELAKMIKDLAKSGSSMQHLSIQADDPQKRRPDLKKFQKDYDFRPKVSLEMGLQKTIEYFKEEI